MVPSALHPSLLLSLLSRGALGCYLRVHGDILENRDVLESTD
jgi:hypothetical protein